MKLGNGVTYPIPVIKELSPVFIFAVFVNEVHFQNKTSFHICLREVNSLGKIRCLNPKTNRYTDTQLVRPPELTC